MTIKYAYIHPYTREYLYAESREELQSKLAEFAAQVYRDHYCNGQLFTFVETLEDGAEKWYAPTGEQTMSPGDIEEMVKRLYVHVGQIPSTLL